jgi:uncharacterized protein
MALIDRTAALVAVRRLLRVAPVVGLLGPRQSGKTTLARQVAAKGAAAGPNFFDLEDPRDEQRLSEPMTALEPLRGLVVIDEVQRRPALFRTLRVLADRRPVRARFLVLGSASPDLIRQSSESLAGRIRFVELDGFSITEVGAKLAERLWLRGGFPRSFLARSDAASFGWRQDFVRTFLERDLAGLGAGVRSPAQMRRLWTMLAHRHAQVWNGAELAGALGESYPTIKRHVDILTGALMIRQLPPWIPNLEKRVVKSPKVFVRDSGLLHALLGIHDRAELEGHPKIGASFEGFVLEEIVRRTGYRDLYFWSTHQGAEVDVVSARRPVLEGFEVKWADAPRMTKSMHIAVSELGLGRLWVVYPGPKRYTLQRNVEVVPVRELDDILR